MPLTKEANEKSFVLTYNISNVAGKLRINSSGIKRDYGELMLINNNVTRGKSS
jgi:hypothetical protein